MYGPLSSQWELNLRSGGQRITTADLYGAIGDTVPLISDLPMSKWSVTVDRRASNRRTASITIEDEAAVDALTSGSSPFNPYGAEVRLYSGFINPDTTTELAPLGIFQVESVGWSHPDSSVRLTLFDRSKVLQRKLRVFPGDVSGLTFTQALDGILSGSGVPIEYVFDSENLDNIIFPGGTTFQGDNLTNINKWSASIGAEAYFDVDGVLQIVPVPFLDITTFSGAADWQVDTGEQGVMVSVDLGASRSDTYNRVIVVGAPGQNNVPQAWADVRDEDPSSPTYYDGPFGKADWRLDAPEVTTYQACLSAGEAFLKNSRGLASTITLKALSNPALSGGDIIKTVYLDGTSSFHLVDSFNLDETGLMNISTRMQVRG